VAHSNLVDAEPREIYIISCLLVPIIGIGLYPRLVTDTYRASVEAMVAKDTAALKLASAPPLPLRGILPPAFTMAPALG